LIIKTNIRIIFLEKLYITSMRTRSEHVNTIHGNVLETIANQISRV